jgi:outer membrane receptor for monomeric catechols
MCIRGVCMRKGVFFLFSCFAFFSMTMIFFFQPDHQLEDWGNFGPNLNATMAAQATNLETATNVETTRYYRTDSRISGVRARLPQSVRVEHVSHDQFDGVATLEFDADRRDYILKKVETVPGIREVSLCSPSNMYIIF